MLLDTSPTPEGFISVLSLAEARREWVNFGAVLTIEDADFSEGLRIDHGRGVVQRVFRFDDTDSMTGPHVAATVDQVRDLLVEARRHRKAKLLVHCLQGQSRSAAIALGIISDRLGLGREDEAVSILKRMRPSSVCNRLVLGHADGLLGRRGSLLGAWDRELARDQRAGGIMLLRELAEMQDREGGPTPR